MRVLLKSQVSTVVFPINNHSYEVKCCISLPYLLLLLVFLFESFNSSDFQVLNIRGLVSYQNKVQTVLYDFLIPHLRCSSTAGCKQDVFMVFFSLKFMNKYGMR